MIRGLEHLSCEERLRVGAVQIGEEKAPGRPWSSLPVLKGGFVTKTDFLPGPVVLCSSFLLLFAS